MKRGKILNDPVYGFINLPGGLVLDLVEHRYFQRLQRIKQLGLTHYVYPGALHSRFHHALGALHLMTEAIESLRLKGVEITAEEAEAAQCAILLHDIGHGPFSHALEYKLINVHHELLTSLFMTKLNEIFNGRLSLAIEIFEDRHHKKFLHQLISGQLDMDRLDYLTRDSFFTGVSEGVVGYNRILKMIAVKDNKLVVEEKGMYSIENFLISRRLMYWQVYLHKTAVSAELMLVKALERAKTLYRNGTKLFLTASLEYFFKNNYTEDTILKNSDEVLEHFSRLDDYDLISSLKEWMFHQDIILRKLSEGIINRKLFKTVQQFKPFDRDFVENLRIKVAEEYNITYDEAHFLVPDTKETNSAYNKDKDEILILFKNGQTKPVSELVEYNVNESKVTQYYICFPE